MVKMDFFHKADDTEAKACVFYYSFIWYNDWKGIWPVKEPALANDVLLIAGLVAYWPAHIHAVALLDLYCLHVTSGRLAVCYSQRRSIFSSGTAFTTAKLRW